MFNIKGNEYRLIAVLDFPAATVIIREVMTHAEYNQERSGSGSTMRVIRKVRFASTDDYLDLVKAFPLRVIRGDREHQEAVVVLSRLVGRENAKLSSGARQYADALARFIEDYDQRGYPMLRTKRSPLEKLKYVMAESGMTPGELAKVLGASQPLTSHILTGKRNLTAAHMRKLGEYLKIAPSVLFYERGVFGSHRASTAGFENAIEKAR